MFFLLKYRFQSEFSSTDDAKTGDKEVLNNFKTVTLLSAENIIFFIWAICITKLKSNFINGFLKCMAL